jgi:hypothetical protein
MLSEQELTAMLCAADWSICPYVAIDNPGAVNLTVAYDCPVIAPTFPAIEELTRGRRRILYSTERPIRECLAEAIALASRGLAESAPEERRQPVTWRAQAQRTAGVYLEARAR